MTTTILAAVGATVLLLQAATRIPPALADLLRALIPVRRALSELLSQPNPLQQGSPTRPASDLPEPESIGRDNPRA
ncbi:hypothetical protein [Nonomuraea bangladeshensis]|uniref:hypothetical protein n=1 Tax=Nonomuraea bangladeshensis TaxID=404385 RepID=UPI003C2F1903